MSKTIGYIGAALLVLAILAAAGLGYWGYQTNLKLQATQAELAALQGKHDTLTASHAELRTSLVDTQTTLSKVKADLASTQADLTVAKSDKATLRSKLDTASSLMEVVDGLFISEVNDAQIETRIKNTGDAKLIQMWNDLKQKVTTENAKAFFAYLFSALDTAFK